MGAAAESFDPGDTGRLRSALGRFATGVTVITARSFDGAPIGFTANSFNSVSLDPPLILWSLARSSDRLGAYRAADAYAVNILSTAQAAVARRFASRVEDRFSGVDWFEGVGGAPVLAGSLAVFECSHEAVYPAGDHELFIGRVERCAEMNGAPLTFFSGDFGTVMGDAEAEEGRGALAAEIARAAAVLSEAPLDDAEATAAWSDAVLADLSPTEAATLRRGLAKVRRPAR